jgi:hypothetical protein
MQVSFVETGMNGMAFTRTMKKCEGMTDIRNRLLRTKAEFFW